MASKRIAGRLRRKQRGRKRLTGTQERPRLTVYRSLKHMYAQIIVDDTGQTVAAASTASKELKVKLKGTANREAAQAVGELIARKALEKKIRKVVFDRNGFLYHGRVKALAEGARQSGLEF